MVSYQPMSDFISSEVLNQAAAFFVCAITRCCFNHKIGAIVGIGGIS